jgi:hypothetical protein
VTVVLSELPPRESVVECVWPGRTELIVHCDDGAAPVRLTMTW